jgi:hypothetical protein
MREWIDKASSAAFSKIDAEFRAALTAAGFPEPVMASEVRQRCQLVKFRDQPFETLLIDGKPYLEIYPWTSRMEEHEHHYTLIMEQPFRRLYASAES